jgi:hypothetical protein
MVFREVLQMYDMKEEIERGNVWHERGNYERGKNTYNTMKYKYRIPNELAMY